MKRIFLTMAAVIIAFSACTKNETLDAPTDIQPAYDLMAQRGPVELNERIVKLHEKFGTYFIYDFDQKDALYTLVNTTSDTGNSQIYEVATPADVEYVGLFLDLLEEAWLSSIPEGKEREAKLPYRVFLADSVGRVNTTAPIGMQYTPQSGIYRYVDNSWVFSRVNHTLPAKGTPAWTTLVNDYIEALFAFPLINWDSEDLAASEYWTKFWSITDYAGAPSKNDWYPGAGSFNDGNYTPGGAYFETIMPGWTSTTNWNATTPAGNYNSQTATDGGKEKWGNEVDYPGPAAAMNDGYYYCAYTDYSVAEQPTKYIKYRSLDVNSHIWQVVTSLGIPPIYSPGANIANPFPSMPFRVTDGPSAWVPGGNNGMKTFEQNNWKNWVWATDAELATVGWFDSNMVDGVEQNKLRVKWQMIVDAYAEAGLDVRAAVAAKAAAAR